MFSFVFGALGNRKILLIFIHIPRTTGPYMCVRGWVDIRFSNPYTRARVCVFTQRIEGLSCVSFTHRSSLDARAQERRDESFRFPFSNSTLHRLSSKRKTSIWRKRLMFLLIENHRTRFFLRSIAPTVLLLGNNVSNRLPLVINSTTS